MKKINKTDWNKIFRLGDKINKDLKLTHTEIANALKGTYTSSSIKQISL